MRTPPVSYLLLLANKTRTSTQFFSIATNGRIWSRNGTLGNAGSPKRVFGHIPAVQDGVVGVLPGIALSKLVSLDMGRGTNVLSPSRRNLFSGFAAGMAAFFCRAPQGKAEEASFARDQKSFRAFKKRNELLRQEQRQAIESVRTDFPDVDEVRWRVFSESAKSFVKLENVVQSFIGYRVDSGDYMLTLIDVDGEQTSLVLAGAAENQLLPVRSLITDRAYNPGAIEIKFLNK